MKGQIAQADNVRAALAPWLNVIRRLNTVGLQHYPGSPVLAAEMMRKDDALRLCELHPPSAELLRQAMGRDKRVKIEERDGFDALAAYLPPPERRGLVLIDPPYEVKTDYRTVLTALKECLRRFATGTYVVWYPRLTTMHARELPEKLKRLPLDSWLHVSLDVKKPSEDGFGMHGSGLFVINPPWTLPETLKTVLPWLKDVLAQDDGADFVLESQIP